MDLARLQGVYGGVDTPNKRFLSKRTRVWYLVAGLGLIAGGMLAGHTVQAFGDKLDFLYGFAVILGFALVVGAALGYENVGPDVGD